MKELREFLDKYDVKYTVEGDTVIAGDIDLYNKGISELPDSIGNLICNYLNLYGNQISELPESIGKLKCNGLGLSNNQISYLPESIGNLKCNGLGLSNNQISYLPESIGNLKCNTLDLDNNKISELSESFGNIKCNYIYLNDNKIKELPESIGNLRCNELWLSNNRIIELPESFGNLKCNHLDLSHNNLIEKPKYDKYKFDNIDITDQYIHCDGLFRWYNSIKQVGEYKVYIGYGEYVVTKDNITFAHGDSIRQAISDLIFKVSDRDKSNYIGLDKDKPLTVEQAIVMYRVITGACSSGVEGFLYGKDIPDNVSVNYILGMVKEGDYGYKEFREFFK